MNLVAITALIAVASAAKLDRTYLPPASAKTADGSSGSLQTPFSGNSFNNGLGGLPKGSYSNEFDGVVVDAALAGTRTAEDGESGLGAPRISYGSSDSRVGAAAFKVNQAGFRVTSGGAQTGFQGQVAGFNRQSAGFDGQSAGSQVSQGFQRPSSNSERPRAALDRAATTLRFENEVGPESYSYAYETDNGIAAEENGVATNGVQAKGGYSYTGDDGQLYRVTYTADEGGYQPKGDHLPTPPPIPEEILKSLEKNARDEAAGLVDDGSYDAQKYNAGTDYAESDSSNGKFNHQSSAFGHGAVADATASGTFINQNNQPFARPNAGQNGFASGSYNGVTAQPGQSSTGFGSFGQSASNGQFGSAGQGSNNGIAGLSGNSASSFLGQFEQSEITQSPDKIIGQSENGIQGTPNRFGSGASSGLKRPSGQRRPGQNGSGATNELSAQFESANGQSNNAFRPSSSGFNSFAQSQSSQGSAFGHNNEYLPPVNTFKQNSRPGATQSLTRPGARPSTKPQESADVSSEESSSTNGKLNESASIGNAVPLSQQAVEQRPQESSFTSFGKPSTIGLSGKPGNSVQSGRPGRPGLPGQSERPGNSGQNALTSQPGQPGFGFSADAAAQSSNNDFKPASNNFVQGAQSSQAAISSLGSNEYLPPVSGFNQNRRPLQNRPQNSDDALQFNEQYTSNTQVSGSFQPQQPGQPGFEAQSSRFNGIQRHQSFNNGRPISQNGNGRSPSPNNGQFSVDAQKGAPAQSSAFASFKPPQATLQPATELVTPLESDSTDDSQSSSQTTSSFSSVSSNDRPGQSQITSNFNSQNASPSPTSPSVFSSFNSQPTSAGRPQRLQSFGGRPTQTPAFPTQSSQGQFGQASRFGEKQPESPQNFAPTDVQYSSSTKRPSFAQQAQGPDDSYYYNQPSKPFGTPQGSIFPNAPSNQFDRMTQQLSFSQSNGQFFNSQNIQNTPFSQNGQPQGAIKSPRPPTLAPPTTQIQDDQPGGSTKYPRPPTLAPVTGITQASISPFPSEAPTSSTQFGTQSQFGSRPSFQPAAHFNQPQITQSGKPNFGQQSTPQSFPQRVQTPSFQSQQTFGQQLLNEPESSGDESQEVTNQQYNGAIYEYNKPAQPLPAPSDKGNTSGSAQFGQKVQGQFGQTKPQFGQTGSPEDQSQITPSLGEQETEVSQGPQFGTQPSRPQFGQNAQASFGTQGGRPQSNGQSRPQFGQTQTSNRFESQTSQDGNFIPQKFVGQTTSQVDNESQEPQTEDTKPFSNTIRPSCCQSSRFGAAKPAQAKPTQGAPSSFSGALSSKPEAGTSSFAGTGEVFGSPDRKPPRFDEKTGYHY